jgi:hypothetical protein
MAAYWIKYSAELYEGYLLKFQDSNFGVKYLPNGCRCKALIQKEHAFDERCLLFSTVRW